MNKPDYVPDKGWFFDIGNLRKDCIIYHNGEQVDGVTKLDISIDANNDNIVSATVNIIDIKAHIKTKKANVNLVLKEI